MRPRLLLCRFFEYSVNSIKKSLTTRYRGNNKFFDMMVNRVAVLPNILGDDQLSGAVVVSQTLRKQECPVGEVLRKTLAKIENQFRRRAAAIGLSDFLHNVRI